MSFINSGLTVLARLATLGVLVAAFGLGLCGVVYLSLQGNEIQMPEITGKNLSQGEHELASLGLKIKKRADRFSPETPNTVIEQMPKPGETVKPGQTVIVVTSKGPGEGELPSTLKTTEEDDTERIEEMISDKPKKAKTSSTKKKADTARDVGGNTAGDVTGSSSNSSEPSSNKKGADGDKPLDKPNKNTQPGGRTASPPATVETRPRRKP